jgi:sec-independent protein translocase protein TatC
MGGALRRIIMPRQTKDLFDDSTMTFGEHLEVLRVHLWKAIIGLALAVIITLIFGQRIVGVVRRPIDRALKLHATEEIRDKFTDDMATDEEVNPVIRMWNYLKAEGFDPSVIWSAGDEEQEEPEQLSPTIQVSVSAYDLLAALNQVNADQFPAPDDSHRESTFTLDMTAPEFSQFRRAADITSQPVTLTVQEAFMTYLKVSLIAGLVLASPWVFYQLWLFVAAGLYHHERKFVYIYGSLSLLLFVVGVLFCFYLVFPFVLKFLLGFNALLEVTPQIRLSEWISFAVLLPLMFGISFQLPLVMRFLNAISVFSPDDYRSKRRLAILVIAFLSMILTPADPMSMLMMMFPLIALYELGILLCGFGARSNPFEAEAA